MITPLVRFTYANVFEPKANLSGALKYSAGLMIPKSDTKSIEVVRKAIDEALAAGLAKQVFTAAATKARTFKYPLRDGDQYYEEKPEASRECYKGHMFISASSNEPIGVVDRFARPIMDRNDFYSGCWGIADVNFYAFNKGGGVGVGCGLNNVMKKRDDDRFDGRMSAEQAFAGQEDTGEERTGEEGIGASDLQ